MTPAEYDTQVAIAWRNVMLDPNSGRLTPSAEKVLADLLTITAFRKPLPMVNVKTGEIDALALALSEGRRQIALRIIDCLEIDPLKLRPIEKVFTDGNP